MKNLQEIIKEVDNWDGTDERIVCTWLRWGEVKLLVSLLRCEKSDEELEETLDNEIEMMNNTVADLNEDLSLVLEPMPENSFSGKFIRHFEGEKDGGCGCAKCETTRYELAEKRGWDEATWAMKKSLSLLEKIVENTKP